MSKKYALATDDIADRTSGFGTAVVSDQITAAGRPIGYMYRESPEDDVDSGWRFLSGDETQAYLDDHRHIDVLDVNDIAAIDGAILDYLDAEPGTHLVRLDGSDEFADADDDDSDDDGWQEIDVDAVDTLDDLKDDDHF